MSADDKCFAASQYNIGVSRDACVSIQTDLTWPITAGGSVNVQLDLVDETVWVNQSGIAELFSTSKQVVSYHLGNIFKEGELVRG